MTGENILALGIFARLKILGTNSPHEVAWSPFILESSIGPFGKFGGDTLG